MYGNKTTSPVIWSAFIDMNQMKWKEDHLDLAKKAYEPLTFTATVVNSYNSITGSIDNPIILSLENTTTSIHNSQFIIQMFILIRLPTKPKACATLV